MKGYIEILGFQVYQPDAPMYRLYDSEGVELTKQPIKARLWPLPKESEFDKDSIKKMGEIVGSISRLFNRG